MHVEINIYIIDIKFYGCFEERVNIKWITFTK